MEQYNGQWWWKGEEKLLRVIGCGLMSRRGVRKVETRDDDKFVCSAFS